MQFVKKSTICPIPNSYLVAVLPVPKQDSVTNTTRIYGTVKEYTAKELVLFGGIAVYKNDTLLTGNETNMDGQFSVELKNIDQTANYRVEFSYLGFYKLKIDSLTFEQGFNYEFDCLLVEKNIISFSTIEVTKCDFSPIIEADNMTKGQIFTSEQIKHSATGG